MEPLKLMSEEDIRQYFIQNGGMVRNTDIVTYFRAYLSNPTIRDEARILFKTYVNKLASVKVENGEKFLVLKRQYFLPIDGNGNSKPPPTLASYPSSASTASSAYTQGYNGPGGPGQQPNYAFQSPPNHQYSNSVNINQTGNAPYGYPTTNSNSANNSHLRRQNSQPQLYGSQFSLNSNYMDPYGTGSAQYGTTQVNSQGTGNFYPASHYSQSNPTLYHQNPSNNNNPGLYQYPQKSQPLMQNQHQNMQGQSGYNQGQGASEYPAEYGLPPAPLGNINQSPPRRYVSPQNSYGSNNSGSPSFRAPPPYRPPPPTLAGRFATSPTGPLSSYTSPPNVYSISRRSSMTSTMGVPYHRTNSVPGSGAGPGSYYSTASTQNVNTLQDYSSPPGMFQYHRSASVTGLPGAVQNFGTTPPGDTRYFDSLAPGATPPPPVPPRSRRSVERSPSAANSLSSSSSSNINSHAGLRGRLTTKMEVEKVNGDSSNQPQQNLQNSNLPSGLTMQEHMRMENDSDGMIDSEQEKENINNLENDSSIHTRDGKHSANPVQNGNSEVEQKISVKERMQKFNRIASESEISGGLNAKLPSARSRREIASKHESGDFDTASLSSLGYGFSHVQLDPKSKDWMMKAMKCDYPVLNKMAQENPALVRRKDMNYTALHWAAKHGNLECVKLLAGAYKGEVNIKSNGGYTPLHLAAQFGRQDVYDVLIKTYNADANIRDHSGKKPMQYLVRQDTSMSMDTFKKLKEKRRNTEQQRERDSSFLRIGSLNVKVKSTREAFGYFLGKSTSSSSIERMHKNWGSADNLPEVENHKDKQMMPPPTGVPRLALKPSKRRQKRSINSQIIKESKSDSDSDSAFGFGSDWGSPVKE